MRTNEMTDSESTTGADTLSDLPDSPLVSVVITTYDEEIYDDFAACVQSVLDQSYEHVEVVIVTETDHAEERVFDQFAELPSVNHVHSEHSLNLASARNLGARRATGDIYAFIDDDAVADQEWLAQIVDAYESEAALAVGGKLTAKWPDAGPKYLPPEFYWLVGVTHRGFSEEAGPVRNTFGANISFRGDVFDKLGGFDVQFGKDHGHNLQSEETELCVRLREGFRRDLYYVPEAVVSHRVYDWQLSWRWLINRAFWQGYSKKLLSSKTQSSQKTELDFFKYIMSESIKLYIKEMYKDKSAVPIGRLIMMYVLTLSVGIGYLTAIIGRRVQSTNNTN